MTNVNDVASTICLRCGSIVAVSAGDLCPNCGKPLRRAASAHGSTSPRPKGAPGFRKLLSTPVIAAVCVLIVAIVGLQFFDISPDKGSASPSAFANASNAPIRGISAADFTAPTENPRSAALTSPEIADLSPCVFFIEVYDAYDNAVATGSGFFIDADGIALTNYHVVNRAQSARIKTTDGVWYDVDGVISSNEEYDTAVIRVSGAERFPALAIGDSTAIKQGETIYTIGSPQGLENTMSNGIISNTARTFDDGGAVSYIQFTAAISSGSSGGALINEYGQVIGITTATLSSQAGAVQNLNFAVPIEDALNSVTTVGEATPLAAVFALPSSMQYYADFPGVPDFGLMHGLAEYYVTDKYYDAEDDIYLAYYCYMAGSASQMEEIAAAFKMDLKSEFFESHRRDGELYYTKTVNKTLTLVTVTTEEFDGNYLIAVGVGQQ
ncbi:MAG: trypsin-like peptidase domain-containing protein [Oscillospiraceae bacterium]|jgi:S1-C subfamily serine protease|nr:trypsin-like peptidase domain-containing protein [Oscillospiraceae bacterium]